MAPYRPIVSDPSADSGLVANFMPNRAYSKVWRGVAVVMLIVAALASVNPFSSLVSGFRARRSWSRTEGRVASAQVVSAPENRSPGGSPSISARRTMYWAEFQVDFLPSNGCRTGITMADSGTPLPCTAFIQTIPHYSSTIAYEWLGRHPSGSSTEILYDPAGPGVKFANESVLHLVRSDRLIFALVFMMIGLAILIAARRRLVELAYLPEGEDLPAPTRPSSRPDEMTDLKLS